MMDTVRTLIEAADPAVTSEDWPPDERAMRELTSILQVPQPTTTLSRRLPVFAKMAWIGLAVVAAVTLIFVATWTMGDLRGQSPIADYPSYGSEQELLAAADLVLTGETTAVHEATIQGVRYAVVTLQVTGVAKGNTTAGTKVEIKFPHSIPTPPGLEVGQRSIVFLSTYSDAPASLLNPDQGSYLVDQTTGAVTGSPDNPIRPSPSLLSELGIVSQ